MLDTTRRRNRSVMFLILVLTAMAMGLASGCGLVDDLDQVLYPSATPGGQAQQPTPEATVAAGDPVEPTAIYTLAATFTWPAPTHTPVAEAVATSAPTPTANPTASQNGHLIYALGGSIMRGDYAGRSAVQVASLPQLESFAFTEGLLAMAQGDQLDLVDLNQGTLASAEVASIPDTDYVQVIWGRAGKAMLYAAMIDDASAPTVGRSVQLVAVAANGAELGRTLIKDATGVNLLSYDDLSGQAYVAPLRGEGSFDQLLVFDMATGAQSQTVSIQGNGAASMSLDGTRLLTTITAEGTTAQMLIYDLTQSGAAPLVWEHPANTHSDAHAWSVDGTKVAFLLRDGATYAEATTGEGLWVLDVAAMEATEVLEEASAAATLVGWTPDSSQIVGLHRGETDGSHYYAVRADGGGREILSVPSEATVLGWMPLVTAADTPQVVVDPWRARFVNAQGSAEALAAVVAEFVAAQLQTPDDELTVALVAHIEAVTEIVSPTEVTLKRAGEGLFVTVLPDNGIYVLENGQATLIARGQLLLDARFEGSDVGVIYGMVSGDTVQPTYLVQRRQTDGSWSMLWAPLGQRDWIATDGEIVFGGEGLGQVNVRGSSFGLDLGQEQVFGECHACPHRWLAGIWLRDGDGYTRHTSLGEGASLSAMTWEMTELRPYSLVHEVLRRLRQGEATDTLVTAGAAEQAQALGLLESNVLLRPDSETPEGVAFSTMDGVQRFTATVQGPQVVSFAAAQ